MKNAEGGQLTSQQQNSFNILVDRLAELRDTIGHRRRGPANLDQIGARILRRFGVEAALADGSSAAVKGISMAAPDHTQVVDTHTVPPSGGNGISIAAPDRTQVFAAHSATSVTNTSFVF